MQSLGSSLREIDFTELAEPKCLAHLSSNTPLITGLEFQTTLRRVSSSSSPRQAELKLDFTKLAEPECLAHLEYAIVIEKEITS